jgi:hypothetical protein
MITQTLRTLDRVEQDGNTGVGGPRGSRCRMMNLSVDVDQSAANSIDGQKRKRALPLNPKKELRGQVEFL